MAKVGRASRNSSLMRVETLGNGTAAGTDKTITSAEAGELYLINHNHASALTVTLPTAKEGAYFKFLLIGSMTDGSASLVVATAGERLIGSVFTTETDGTDAATKFDDGSDDRLLPMHQELEQLSLLTVNLWMPLKDVGPGKGGLRIIKGSHKHGLRKHQVCPESGGYYLPENLDYVAGDIITLELGAGDALMFHPFLIHGSEINKSREVRWTIAARLSETTTCPFLRSEHASLYMERNPDPKSPGNEFVSQYLNKD